MDQGTPTELRFRLYEAGDLEACRSVLLSNVGPFFAEGEREEIEDVLRRLTEFAAGAPDRDEDSVWWVGEVEGRVVAMGGLEREGETVWLCWGTVHRDAQGRGYGSALLRHRLDEAPRLWPDARTALSWTAPATEGFYARFGFVTKERRPAYWGGELDLVVMELPLTHAP